LLENEWFNNTLFIFEAEHVSNLVWWWYFYGPYAVYPYGESSATSIARPLTNGAAGNLHGDTGGIMIRNWHETPFVFSIGNETHSGSDYGNYYCYSNNTVWSSSWSSSQLNISLTVGGLAQLRVGWNATRTSAYPINSTLQIEFSNGTVTQANSTYVSKLDMLIFNLTDTTTSVLIGYNLEAAVTVSVTSPINTTYTSSTISVSFTASGGTIDQYWFNCKNGSSWIYVSNQTGNSGAFTGFVNGASYTGYFWANNTDGNIGEATVMFSVSVSGGTSQLIVNVWWSNYW
jgi:hypothetical protein